MINEKNIEMLKQLLYIIVDDTIDQEDKHNISPESNEDSKIIMLTIKECRDVIYGLSENTLRMLIKQGKIPYVRAGIGKHGKILINKNILLKYFSGHASMNDGDEKRVG